MSRRNKPFSWMPYGGAEVDPDILSAVTIEEVALSERFVTRAGDESTEHIAAVRRGNVRRLIARSTAPEESAVKLVTDPRLLELFSMQQREKILEIIALSPSDWPKMSQEYPNLLPEAQVTRQIESSESGNKNKLLLESSMNLLSTASKLSLRSACANCALGQVSYDLEAWEVISKRLAANIGVFQLSNPGLNGAAILEIIAEKNKELKAIVPTLILLIKRESEIIQINQKTADISRDSTAKNLELLQKREAIAAENEAIIAANPLVSKYYQQFRDEFPVKKSEIDIYNIVKFSLDLVPAKTICQVLASPEILAQAAKLEKYKEKLIGKTLTASGELGQENSLAISKASLEFVKLKRLQWQKMLEVPEILSSLEEGEAEKILTSLENLEATQAHIAEIESRLMSDGLEDDEREILQKGLSEAKRIDFMVKLHSKTAEYFLYMLKRDYDKSFWDIETALQKYIDLDIITPEEAAAIDAESKEPKEEYHKKIRDFRSGEKRELANLILDEANLLKTQYFLTALAKVKEKALEKGLDPTQIDKDLQYVKEVSDIANATLSAEIRYQREGEFESDEGIRRKRIAEIYRENPLLIDLHDSTLDNLQEMPGVQAGGVSAVNLSGPVQVVTRS